MNTLSNTFSSFFHNLPQQVAQAAPSDAPINELQIEELGELGENLALNLSLYDMLANADWVVRITMLILVLASIIAWAIIVHKSYTLTLRRRQAAALEKRMTSGSPLYEIARSLESSKGSGTPFAQMFLRIMREWQQAQGSSNQRASSAHLINRVEWIIEQHSQKLANSLGLGMSLLAAISSAAPFIGLFGTVWGIMNSFRSIAVAQEAHLAVVAPGIAEALLATAAGLVAAIPAVIAYNLFSTRINHLVENITQQGETFLTVLARHLDQGPKPQASPSSNLNPNKPARI